MKKISTLLAAVLLTATIWAQSPEKMSYQAVIRKSDNSLVVNTQVRMTFNIRQGSPTGTIVYTETQTPTTNDNGLVSVEIGENTGFNAIDWSAGSYFIETKTDPAGGINYTITGTSQLLSVPYALHAKTAERVNETDTVYGLSAAALARINALERTIVLNYGLTDTRDDNHYNVVKIGKQIWMAENLRYLPSVDNPDTGSKTIPYYYVYGYNGTSVSEAKATINYSTYGVLYNWPAAMASSSISTANPSGVQGVCPVGWHLPSDSEWVELINYMGGNNVAGSKLKETGTSHWESPNNEATNEVGFTALPGGHRISLNGGKSMHMGSLGSWWTATLGRCTVIYSNHNRIDNEGLDTNSGLSVRCVKD